VKREAFALAFAMLFPTAVAWFDFVALARPPEENPGHNPAVVAVWVSGKVIQFGFPVLWVWLVERRRPSVLPAHFQGLRLGLAFGLIVGAGTLLLYYGILRHLSFFKGTPGRVHDKMVEFGLATPAAYFLFSAFLSVIHSFLEEYYWRWFVFGRLQRHVSLGLAIGLSSLAFMAHHVIDLAMFFPGAFWTMAVPLSACVGLGGAVWAWLYHRTGSIYAPWLSHLLIDAAIMIVGYDLAFGKAR
jgi:membrane protease YdiL (CAAX protease family)